MTFGIQLSAWGIGSYNHEIIGSNVTKFLDMQVNKA